MSFNTDEKTSEKNSNRTQPGIDPADIIAVKANQVMEVYHEIDRETSEFAKKAGLFCRDGCGHCCIRDVEASVLECIPLAYHLHREGITEQWLQRLNTDPERTMCALFSETITGQLGHCIAYDYRPLVCRLFGYSAVLDKGSKPRIVTCETMKQELNEQYRKAVTAVENGLNIPIMKNYYFKLMSIDHLLTQGRYPLVTAIELAIEKVSAYYMYRE